MSVPVWLIAPGLLVPPAFIPLFLCVVPHPVAPALPIPELDVDAASLHLRLAAGQADRLELTSSEQDLIDRWHSLQRAELEALRSPGASKSRVEEAQRRFREDCTAIRGEGEEGRLAALGQKASITLTRALTRLETRGPGAEAEVRRLGGAFLTSARASGLIDRHGRLVAHPIVPYALALMRWRLDCGAPLEEGLRPIELDGVDLYRIRFGTPLPIELRLRSVQRYSQRYPDYPGELAEVSLLLSAGEVGAAFEKLRHCASRSPRSLALRNYLIYVETAQE